MEEHFDTKSVVNLKSTSLTRQHSATIFVKWRVFGRYSNRRAIKRIPPVIPSNSRDPVSLCMVEEVVRLSGSF